MTAGGWALVFTPIRAGRIGLAPWFEIGPHDRSSRVTEATTRLLPYAIQQLSLAVVTETVAQVGRRLTGDLHELLCQPH